MFPSARTPLNVIEWFPSAPGCSLMMSTKHNGTVCFITFIIPVSCLLYHTCFQFLIFCEVRSVTETTYLNPIRFCWKCPSARRLSKDFDMTTCRLSRSYKSLSACLGPGWNFLKSKFLELRRAGPEQVWNPVWYILESKMFARPMLEWENDLRV